MDQETQSQGTKRALTKQPFRTIQKQAHDWINDQGLPSNGGAFTMTWDTIDSLVNLVNEQCYEHYEQQYEQAFGGAGTQPQTQRISESVQEPVARQSGD